MLNRKPIKDDQFLGINYQIDLLSLLEEKRQNIDSAQSIRKKVYERQEYIYEFANHANEIYIIKKGRVKIENHTEDAKIIIKNVFTGGEVFGELSLIGKTQRNDFAITMERTELYILSPDELFYLMEENSRLTAYVIRLLATRLNAAEKKIESFVFKKSRTRIIEFLGELAKKRGKRVGYDILIRKFFTHQEIANFTATSRQTVTTVLNELRKKDILTFDRRRLLIRDLDLLRGQLFNNGIY